MTAIVPASAIDRNAARDAWRSYQETMRRAAAAAARGDLTAAERGYADALEIAEALGNGSLRHARAADGLADVWRLQERYEEAEQGYRETLASFERLLGEDQPRVATTMHNLAVVLLERGLTAEAEDLFRRSREIWERRLGENSVEVAVSLEATAALLQRTERWQQAQALLERAERIRAGTLPQGTAATTNGIE